MANETTKMLNTRIALKFDSYDAWQSSDLKLLPGEMAICEVPGTDTEVEENGKKIIVKSAPTVLFKVGAYKKDADGNPTTE